MFPQYTVIFFISLFAILLELFFTRILNLKTWNHVVYIIIPYAILGYGIGSLCCLLFKEFFQRFRLPRLMGACVLLLSASSLACSLTLIYLPVKLSYLVNFFVSPKAGWGLFVSYTVLLIPFFIVGFLVVYLFTQSPKLSHKLYFYDLIGAGLGAFLFYPLIHSAEVFHSLFIFSWIGLVLAFVLLFEQKKVLVFCLTVALGLICYPLIPEPDRYTIDKAKGWEWIPGYFESTQYDRQVSRWHALGRTEIFRITGDQARDEIYGGSVGTFEINVEPLPEFSYISTNYLAGTPIYRLSEEGMRENSSAVKLFSQAMEFPYTLLEKPKVLVIGAGGGRDIFMAKTHGAREVIGAEINPGITKEMAPGGAFYEYSGKVYTLEDTQVFNVDGRHLVKRQKPDDIDLIILNGVDTFSGLSSGAYSYAESYLYTKEALMDYLRILKPEGMVNFNRWFFPEQPRETLRLFAITLDALRSLGAQNPGEHIIIGYHQRWSLILIKKTPFTQEERETVLAYFQEHDTDLSYPRIYPDTHENIFRNIFNTYLSEFNNGNEALVAALYPYDISVITDNDPFFYKYYKLRFFNPLRVFSFHHTGTVVFMTQGMVLLQSIVFIILFIFLPLLIYKKKGMKVMSFKMRNQFVLYFGCLGVGFMFIEIPLMQRFVLLLGSPIYAISVVLAVLLIGTGTGSYLLPLFHKITKSRENCVTIISIFLIVTLLAQVLLGTAFFDHFMAFSFFWRVFVVCLMMFPLGIMLGIYFPSGLQLVQDRYPDAIPWAWGINAGFSVLGSILAIILAQFMGFSNILILACVIYLLGTLSFCGMVKEVG